MSISSCPITKAGSFRFRPGRQSLPVSERVVVVNSGYLLPFGCLLRPCSIFRGDRLIRWSDHCLRIMVCIRRMSIAYGNYLIVRIIQSQMASTRPSKLPCHGGCGYPWAYGFLARNSISEQSRFPHIRQIFAIAMGEMPFLISGYPAGMTKESSFWVARVGWNAAYYAV